MDRLASFFGGLALVCFGIVGAMLVTHCAEKKQETIQQPPAVQSLLEKVEQESQCGYMGRFGSCICVYYNPRKTQFSVFPVPNQVCEEKE